jgi:diguanylate cyclase (GGDEF)-like protein
VLKATLARLWRRAWSLILIEMTAEEVGWLFWPGGHLSLLVKRRTSVILTRVRLVAGLFAVLTPLWIVVDMAVFPAEIWQGLAWARVVASAAFCGVVVIRWNTDWRASIYAALVTLLAVPSAFFLFSYAHIEGFELQGLQKAIASGYTFLPFVMLAGLSIFPLTLVECLAFAVPTLALPLAGAAMTGPVMDIASIAVTVWLLLLIVSVSALAGLSQLGFMIVFIREAIRDNMTGCFTRNSGEELLDLQFILSTRIHAPLSLAFIDLDHFKQVNDSFGHEAGDQVLRNATLQLRRHLRAGDILARWGGEEFILIMPNTTQQQACQGLLRVYELGLGVAPDGRLITASIGVAERIEDNARDWNELVELADVRMYEAKQAGRNRIVSAAALEAA